MKGKNCVALFYFIFFTYFPLLNGNQIFTTIYLQRNFFDLLNHNSLSLNHFNSNVCQYTGAANCKVYYIARCVQ
jgi:hypothetical protein